LHVHNCLCGRCARRERSRLHSGRADMVGPCAARDPRSIEVGSLHVSRSNKYRRETQKSCSFIAAQNTRLTRTPVRFRSRSVHRCKRQRVGPTKDNLLNCSSNFNLSIYCKQCSLIGNIKIKQRSFSLSFSHLFTLFWMKDCFQ
jgi:hypothetical protein